MAPYFLADYSITNGEIQASYVKDESDSRTSEISEAQVFDDRRDAESHVIKHDTESQIVYVPNK